MSIFTIGHSNRSFQEFLELLKRHDIKCLVDVRTFPSSKKFPHFNQDKLKESLRENGIQYHHLKSLGGLRRSGLDNSPNTGWETPGFQNYADHMLSTEFREALASLCQLAFTRNTAIMCAEAVPWRCHRQLISDALLSLKGKTVVHIIGPDRAQEHELSRFAKREDDRLIYPPTQDELFD